MRIDVTGVVRRFVDADGEHLVIQMWREGRGFHEVRRRQTIIYIVKAVGCFMKQPTA
ncbi:hypothetical protein GCM10014719_54730 [Planomonospora parontospora subsp. antibiotica]|uniref:hypothetical protein n=1 Tax=Planomonospora parontospora TaxID=58119 RepID=UPI0016706766|nr:hypothetical protein [Planomonospora parontospora]GGL46519.1 hypothetical protein GCM10014719_54730 [Planomonospora parontospora subsp. antibiotica]GII19389.1 hypothetical protein Ppa05_61150 [Planomonospora parontospora subsp. antibiotica]